MMIFILIVFINIMLGGCVDDWTARDNELVSFCNVDIDSGSASVDPILEARIWSGCVILYRVECWNEPRVK